MAKRSQTVAEKVAELYAMMATQAARKAIETLKTAEDPLDAEGDAELWAEMAGKWLDKSSANAARWTYRAPAS